MTETQAQFQMRVANLQARADGRRPPFPAGPHGDAHAELSAALAPIEIEVAQFDGWADGERIETLTLGELRRLIRAAEAVLR